MKLKNIQTIVNSGLENWEALLIAELSQDENIIPILMRLLDAERETKKDLLRDSNSELSRALVTIIDENYGKKGAYIDRIWVAGEIKNHYLRWQEHIRCNFKIEGLPD